MNMGYAKNLRGSVLLYVLWILVVISLLAFKFSSASRVVMIKQVSDVTQIKRNLQLTSAIRFASFKILNNDWKDNKFEQNLNNQQIGIEIYNEAGFIPLYDLSSQSLKNAFDAGNIELSDLDELKVYIGEKKLRFNDFAELTQFEGISAEAVRRIIPYVSIYHDEGVNPDYSPAEVLMKLQGVDQFRVNKIIESSDSTEIAGLRKEIREILNAQNFIMGEFLIAYYRVHVTLDSRLYRVFLKLNQRDNEFLVVNTIYPDELVIN